MDVFIDEVISFIVAVGAAALLPIVVGAAIRLLQYAGLQVAAEQQAKIERMLGNLLLETEEYFAAKIKARIPTTSKDKLEYYLARVADKVPGITPDEATALAESLLPQLGLGAAVALRDLRLAATSETAPNRKPITGKR